MTSRLRRSVASPHNPMRSFGSALQRNILALFAIQGITYLTPFIVLPYLFRALGGEVMGRVMVMLAFMQYLQLLVDYGFNLTATKRAARNQDSTSLLGELLVSVLAVRLGICAAAFAIGLAAVQFLPFLGQNETLYLACFVQVLGQAMNPQWIYQGLERLPVFSAFSALARLTSTALALLLVRGPDDAILAALSLTVVFPLTALPALVHAHSKRLGGLGLPLGWPSWSTAVRELRDGWLIFRSTLAISLYTSANPLIVAAFVSGPAVGGFTTLERLVRALQNLIGPVGQALFPRVNSLLAQDRKRAVALLRTSFQVMGLLGAAVSLVLLLAAPLTVRLVTGAEAPLNVTMLRLLAAIPWLVALSNLFGIQTLLSFGQQQVFSRVLTYVGLGCVLLSLGLTWTWGAIGTAVTSTLAEVMVTGVFWRASSRHVGGWLHGRRPQGLSI